MREIYLSIVCLTLLTSCAATGTKKVYVNTEPSGAVASMGGQACSTPCDMVVSEKGEYILHVTKIGYKEENVELGLAAWERSPWVVGVATTATLGMLIAWPELIAPAIGGTVLSYVWSSDEKINISMKPKEESE